MQAQSRLRGFLWIVVGIVAFVALDQWFKQVMVDWIGPGAGQDRVEILGRAFAFEYLENRGAAFGLFQTGTTVLSMISVIAVIVGLVLIWRTLAESIPLASAIALIVAGAAGNAIDRIMRGFVVDYIAIGRFWKFNLADSAVTIGAILALILLILADSGHQSKQETTQ